MQSSFKGAGVGWPAVSILALAAGFLIWVWYLGEKTGQEKVTYSATALGLTLIALLIWVVGFSRLSRRIRASVLVLFAVLAVSLPALVRIRGVSGDLMPILEWRWTPKADMLLESPSRLRRDEPPEISFPQSRDAITTDPGADATPASPKEQPAREPRDAPGREARDFPQFLGPDRNARLHGIRLARDWQRQPPRLVWRREIGAGWSGFAVAGGIAVTQEQRGGREMVVAYGLSTGRTRWSHADSLRYESVMAGDGPRATPTISGDRVYSLGATGILNCLDLKSGKRIWSRDIARDNDAGNPPWGRSCSPLVTDDLVIVSAGGSEGKSLVAYRRDSGEPVWHGGDDEAGYSSPTMATLAGRRQILIFNQASVAAHDPGSGRVLWLFAWPATQPNVAQPITIGEDRVLVSSGYGVGSKMLRITPAAGGELRCDLVWESTRLKAKFTNVVFYEGFVYGLDDGILVCLDPVSGERRWKSGRYGHGQVLLVEDLLLVQSEAGEIVLVDPKPEEHIELTRFAALKNKTWNSPTLASPFLLVRNDLEAACYELPLER